MNGRKTVQESGDEYHHTGQSGKEILVVCVGDKSGDFHFKFMSNNVMLQASRPRLCRAKRRNTGNVRSLRHTDTVGFQKVRGPLACIVCRA